MYAAVSVCLALLILAAAGVLWFAVDSQPADSDRTTEPAGDPILFLDPWSRHRFADMLGKVLLPPERLYPPHNDGQAPFAGPQACAECHPGRLQGFLQTSHARASQIASPDTVMGSFQAPGNRLATRERQLHYRMDMRSDGLYQTAVVGGRDVHGERMDIIFGSGKMGQSYLYWRDDELFQLPISYFAAHDAWMNSPGYPDGAADFTRPIASRCLDCHTTWFDARGDDELTSNQYSPEGFILGVTCERCHGPGDEHVAYHRAHPDDRQAQHIVHPGRLPHERLLDVCLQCHGGLALPIRPAFTFRPGENLTDYLEPAPESAAPPGIHTNNQIQRLSMSRCFQQSPRMSCVTCHNPHQFERGNDALFAIRCQQCHEIADCGLEPQIGSALGNQCTRCHMPRQPLLATPLNSEDGVVFPEMFDHFIRTGVSDRQLEEQLRAAAGND